MKALKLTVFFLFAACASLALAHGMELHPLWEKNGFNNPESVLYDADRDVLYVSNVNGDSGARDGNGFISRVSLEGDILQRDWVTGLDAPKGMAIVDGRLYVSDIDTLVEIDIDRGAVARRYRVDGAGFLNDVAAFLDGTVYVSDTAANTIYMLHNGRVDVWLRDDRLNGPNGLVVEGNYLMVAGMGPMGGPEPSQLIAVSRSSKSITSITRGKAVGKLDGLAVNHDGDYVVSDWPAGKIMLITRSGEVQDLVDVAQGSADLALIEEEQLLLVPMMLDNKLVAYRVHALEEDGHHADGPEHHHEDGDGDEHHHEEAAEHHH